MVSAQPAQAAENWKYGLANCMFLTVLLLITSFFRYLSFMATSSKFACSDFISSKGVITRASAVLSL